MSCVVTYYSSSAVFLEISQLTDNVMKYSCHSIIYSPYLRSVYFTRPISYSIYKIIASKMQNNNKKKKYKFLKFTFIKY